jgi:hypothetical protein
MLPQQQREKSWKSTGHCNPDTSLFSQSQACGLAPQGYSPWTSLQYRFEFCTHVVLLPVSRGPAIWATVVALALINVGAAASIVDLMRSGTFLPLWIGLVFTALGVVALLAAVRLWQRYLAELRRA